MGKLDPVNRLLETVDRKIMLEGAEIHGLHQQRRAEENSVALAVARGAASSDDPFYSWDPEELALELGRSPSETETGDPIGWFIGRTCFQGFSAPAGRRRSNLYFRPKGVV